MNLQQDTFNELSDYSLYSLEAHSRQFTAFCQDCEPPNAYLLPSSPAFRYLILSRYLPSYCFTGNWSDSSCPTPQIYAFMSFPFHNTCMHTHAYTHTDTEAHTCTNILSYLRTAIEGKMYLNGFQLHNIDISCINLFHASCARIPYAEATDRCFHYTPLICQRQAISYNSLETAIEFMPSL